MITSLFGEVNDLNLLFLGPTSMISSPLRSTGGIVSHSRICIEALKGDFTRLYVISFDDISMASVVRKSGVLYIIFPRGIFLNLVVSLFRARMVAYRISRRRGIERILAQGISYYLFVIPFHLMSRSFIFVHGIMAREYSPFLNNDLSLSSLCKWFLISFSEFVSYLPFRRFILINNEMAKFFYFKKTFLLRNQISVTSVSVVPKERFVLCVGNIIPRKRQLLLAEAFVKLAKSDWSLVFVGRGRGWYHDALVATTALYENVELRSDVSDVELQALLARAQIFCLPSVSESSPISILEACEFGCSVIASSVGGIPEIQSLSSCPADFLLFTDADTLLHSLEKLMDRNAQFVNHDIQKCDYRRDLLAIIR